jgi:hypothetical protein
MRQLVAAVAALLVLSCAMPALAAADGVYGEPPAAADKTPPEVTFVQKPSHIIHTRRWHPRITVAFTSNEWGVTYHCALDQHPLQRCTSPVHYRVGPGKHTFTLTAVDAAGNTTRSSFDFTVVHRHAHVP